MASEAIKEQFASDKHPVRALYDEKRLEAASKSPQGSQSYGEPDFDEVVLEILSNDELVKLYDLALTNAACDLDVSDFSMTARHEAVRRMANALLICVYGNSIA